MINQNVLKPVPIALLQALASEAPAPATQDAAPTRATPSNSAAPAPKNAAPTRATPTSQATSGAAYTSRLLVDRWLRDRGREFQVKPDLDDKERTVYVLKQCPFDSSHAAPDSCIMQGADGKLAAHCFHNSCQGKGWQEFKQAIGAPEGHHYDPPFRRSSSKERADAPALAAVEISLHAGDALKLQVHLAAGKAQRLVLATRGAIEHRDRIDVNRATSREKFARALAKKIGMEPAVLLPLIEGHLIRLASEADASAPAGGEIGDDAKSQATRAVELAVDWDLWHSPVKDAFATIQVGDHLEAWPVKSQTFNRLVGKQFFDETGSAMNSESLKAAGNLLEARALFDGAECPVFVRVAEHAGNIYIDLCNKSWQVVEITPQDWSVIAESPVRFRRSRSMQALPTPLRGGRVDMLRPFVSVDDQNWILIVAWLVAALSPRGPYPILALFAEHGAGKSTQARMLRDLIDPNASPLRAGPKDCRDLMISADNSWCLAFDNLSYIPPWLSDALCRLSTGGGFSTRELYENKEEIIFEAKRPILINSIEEIATRPDLLERCNLVAMTPIDDDKRKTEAALEAEFHKAQPLILGALFDAVSVGLRLLPKVKLMNLPRMADFAKWVTAAEMAFGWQSGTFMAAYKVNGDCANKIALEASLVVPPLLELLQRERHWEGPAGELLSRLEKQVGDTIKRLRTWPKGPRALSAHLRRIAPNLRKIGWNFVSDRDADKRSLIIRPC